MIAVFCRYEIDFKMLEPTPKKMFKRIRNIRDVVGRTFTGVIKIHNLYECGEEITDAYKCLKNKQPELFS